MYVYILYHCVMKEKNGGKNEKKSNVCECMFVYVNACVNVCVFVCVCVFVNF